MLSNPTFKYFAPHKGQVFKDPPLVLGYYVGQYKEGYSLSSFCLIFFRLFKASEWVCTEL